MKDIKLIALDLDGTLFNREGIITPANKAELNRAAAQGVKIVISTGRPFNGLPFEQIKDTAIEYALTTNGASVYKIENKECLYEDGMDVETILPLLDWILEREIHIDIYMDGVGFTPVRCRDNIGRLAVPESLRKYMIETRTTVEDLKRYVGDCGKKIQKINLNFYPQSDGTFLHRDETLQYLKANKDITVVGGGFNNFEISKTGVTKREGLSFLAKYLGTDLKHTMAMGDSENDLSMINAAGIGVAMENATEDVKSVANYITASNEEDGVAKAVKHFIPTL